MVVDHDTTADAYTAAAVLVELGYPAIQALPLAREMTTEERNWVIHLPAWHESQVSRLVCEVRERIKKLGMT